MISSSSPTSRRPHYYIIPAPWLCSRRHLTNKSIVSRVQTELESYPATLFNILADSPNWFTEARTAISSTTTATQPSSASNAGNNEQLVNHIVGARGPKITRFNSRHPTIISGAIPYTTVL